MGTDLGKPQVFIKEVPARTEPIPQRGRQPKAFDEVDVGTDPGSRGQETASPQPAESTDGLETLRQGAEVRVDDPLDARLDVHRRQQEVIAVIGGLQPEDQTAIL